MHLLKNFGTGGGVKTSASPGGASKNSYFSNLNNQYKASTEQNKKKQKNKVQGPPKGFIPQNFALDFDKPTISKALIDLVLQYRNPQNQKLYHHKMPIKKLKKDTPTKVVLDYLKKKHYHYFIPKVIDQQQVEKLIDRLKNGLIGEDDMEGLDDVDEQDFDFDYEDDFDV